MTTTAFVLPSDTRVVIADANVLYSRALRDYLLIACEQEIIDVHWSPQILQDTLDHLMANRPGFTPGSAQRLKDALRLTFPDALITPAPEHLALVAGYDVPDPDDRDVMAVALAAEATIVCTLNRRHFPPANKESPPHSAHGKPPQAHRLAAARPPCPACHPGAQHTRLRRRQSCPLTLRSANRRSSGRRRPTPPA